MQGLDTHFVFVVRENGTSLQGVTMGGHSIADEIAQKHQIACGRCFDFSLGEDRRRCYVLQVDRCLLYIITS